MCGLQHGAYVELRSRVDEKMRRHEEDEENVRATRRVCDLGLAPPLASPAAAPPTPVCETPQVSLLPLPSPRSPFVLSDRPALPLFPIFVSGFAIDDIWTL